MNARKPILAILALLCVLACALAVEVGSAEATTQFGSYGGGAGQFEEPWGIAVDQSSGDVYVADAVTKRIDEFEASGGFVRAWGWGVLTGAEELQACTTTCKVGIGGGGEGQLGEGITGMAVDNDPLSSSYGDVYAFDASNYAHVEKFDSTGKFLLQFKAEGGTESTIAVGPGGKVYIGGEARVQVFEPSGVLSETISLAGLSSTGYVTALAVDSSGDVFVVDSGVSGIREFEANGTEKTTRFDAGSKTVQALTVDGSGDLFVDEVSALYSPATVRFLEYSPSGEELASFDNEPALGFREGIAFSSALGVGELYVTTFLGESGKFTGANVSMVNVPVSGPPVIRPGSVTATGGQRGHAAIKATLDAEGNPTTYRVEYVNEADFQANGYADASSTPEVSLGSKFAEVPVNIELSELEPGVVYHYRIVLSNTQGAESSPDQTVETVPAALIDGPWVAGVSSTSATFAAEVDPLGSSTEYRIEYGPTTAYGETLAGSVGGGETYVSVSFHRQNLTPSTVYHYRLVVHNEVGVYATPDHSFITQAASQESGLPDGRVWELVSPVDKKGALIAAKSSEEPFQAAADGSAVAYPASEPVGEDVVGRGIDSVILSERGPDGWSSRDVSAPNSLVSGRGEEDSNRGGATLRVFSNDLSLGLYQPEQGNDGGSPLSPEATERTLYLRVEPGGSYLPLETPTDVTQGTKFYDDQMNFVSGTPDLSHVIFETTAALTPGAVPSYGSSDETGVPNLYEWSGGKLQLVNVYPDGKSEPDAWLGNWEQGTGSPAHAISSDGRWVVWTHGRLLGGNLSLGEIKLYVRDMVDGRTYQIGGKYPRFETMSSDGSKVFFVETNFGRAGDLYVFDTATGTQTDLTADHAAGETNAGVQDAVMGASEDGSYVYFVATGVLASGAVKGADNVYVLHESEGVWTTKYIATLADEDSKSWRGHPGELPGTESQESVRPELVSSRVSPNGRYLVFMSERSLTGYDNLDAVSGQPDEEVYLYDAMTGHLTCASCNPTGARPVGVFDDRSGTNPLLADLYAAWSESADVANHWLAGSIPGWVHVNNNLPSYQPRYLSNSGRLFFDSPDALVPQDTNGLEDVYEYEPPGVGSCTNASATFSERSQGCVSLMSSGHSGSESMFVDASENGNDVFFATNEKLVNEDYDTAYDVYDAHVCSNEAPCHGEADVPPPPCTSGDACKAAPSPQPEIFGAAPSATFSGVGNVTEEAKQSVVKRKAKTKPKRKPKAKKRAKRKHRAKKARRTHSGGTSGKGR